MYLRILRPHDVGECVLSIVFLLINRPALQMGAIVHPLYNDVLSSTSVVVILPEQSTRDAYVHEQAIQIGRAHV